MGQNIPLLKQATCLGNNDAMFTLAAALNNGVGTKVQEAEVATEMVRLIDEATMEQQTDESGDLFLWLKHQAQQGVTSAQVQLAHLLFWGSQGVRRNLQAAREFFQQGAAQGDADSMYNIGLMQLFGRGGTEKNESAGKEALTKAAEKRHPFSISALGWLALEKERNYTKAAALFEDAYKLGQVDAGYYLGHLYHWGLYPNKSQSFDGVTAMIGKECQWRHYNLTIQRENQFVDPYSYIKMGDFFWYGCLGQRNLSLAADYYKSAAVKKDPHALFNLAFMLEEGTEISESVWKALKIPSRIHKNNVTLLMKLYEKCRESRKSEAFIPCTLALYRIWLVDLWTRYHIWMKMSTYAGSLVAAVGTFYLLFQCYSRHRQQDIQLYQL
nr:hypothetical protein BaRGS_034921 [Batillaria attramentaria]